MNNITVAGLGFSGINGLTVETYRLLFESPKDSTKIICRTEVHEVVAELKSRGIEYEALDSLYDDAEDFDSLEDSVLSFIKECISRFENIIYAVPGSPTAGDRTVLKLLEMYDEVHVLPSEGVNEYIASVTNGAHANGVNTLPAHTFRKELINTRVTNIITEADNKFLVSDIKLALLEMYPDDHEITYFYGYPSPKFEKIPLSDMDRQKIYDFSVNFIILPLDNFAKKLYDIGALFEIMRILRGQSPENPSISLKFNPEGCSWDKEQTHESIRQNMIEEAYEVIEAINNNDLDNMIEELGDMLLQVIFHSQIAAETGEFTFDDVVNGIASKLVRRHPHVFGDASANNAEEAYVNWEQVKKQEKSNKTVAASIAALPKDLPPFTKAQKVISKTASKGFCHSYSDKASAVTEALCKNVDNDNIAEILFGIAETLKKMDINPDIELKKFTDNYISEFAKLSK